MAVHDVDMDPVGAGGVDRAHLLAELGEIGGEDRRCDNQRAWHGASPSVAVRVTCRWRSGNAAGGEGGKICPVRRPGGSF